MTLKSVELDKCKGVVAKMNVVGSKRHLTIEVESEKLALGVDVREEEKFNVGDFVYVTGIMRIDEKKGSRAYYHIENDWKYEEVINAKVRKCLSPKIDSLIQKIYQKYVNVDDGFLEMTPKNLREMNEIIRALSREFDEIMPEEATINLVSLTAGF